MPRLVKKKKTRSRDADPDVVTRPSRRQTPGINPFNIPTPKGPNPGRQTRSTVWVPKERSSAAEDPEEAAAFAPREGDVMPNDRRSRQVSAAALSAAQLRMSGRRVEDEEDAEDGDEQDEEDVSEPEDEPEEEIEPAPRERTRGSLLVNRAPHNAGTPANHPSAEYEGRDPEPAPRSSNVARRPEGTLEHKSGLSLSPITISDVDRLWDWIRGDDDGGQAFLWHRLTTSLSLHQFMQSIATSEQNGVAMIRSIYGGGQHLGFAMLAPILAEENTALMHAYLRKDVRGSLAQMIGPLVEMVTEYRTGLHLAVWSPDDVWARLHRKLLSPLGFTERVMFIR